MQIRWEDPGVRAKYEDLIANLIKRLHPRAQRIDGSGGDEGRDVQVPSDDGLAIYELKSFTGRLSKGGRKAQVSRSLAKAATHDPDSWHLVVPIDPTPGELAWFESLTGEYSFPCSWLGRTWLDTELAQRPEIPRYYLDDYRAEVAELLRELRSEELAMDDATHAAARARAIRRRLNESDPHYSYALLLGSKDGPRTPGAVLSFQTGEDRIDVVPRYATAVKDRPITVNATFDFSADTEGHREAFERSLDFGEPVRLPASVVRDLVIDAPGGLAAEHERGELWMGGLDEELDPPVIVHATVYSSDKETPLGTHEFQLTRRRGGRRGAVLQGTDSSGLLSLAMRGDRERGSITFNLTFGLVPTLPPVGLLASRWLELLRPPNFMTLTLEGHPFNDLTPINDPIVEDTGPTTFFEAFHLLQQRAGVAFPVPDDITDDEWSSIARVAAWMSPEKLEFTWTSHRVELAGVDQKALRQLLRGGALFETVDVSIDFRGRRLQLGRLARTLYAQPADPPAIRRALDRGETALTIDFVPGESDTGYEWLLEPGDPILTM